MRSKENFMYFLDLLQDITGNENIVSDLINEYFSRHLFSDPYLKNMGECEDGYLYEVRDRKIAIGTMSRLHVGDYNFYFDNQLEEDCNVNYNKQWIAIVYNKLKQLSPAFAEQYEKNVREYLSFVNASSKQKVESKYGKLVKLLTDLIKEEREAIDRSTNEVYEIFSDEDNNDKAL